MPRFIRPLLAAGLTLLAGLVIAQSEDRLPRESAYLRFGRDSCKNQQ